MQGTSVTWSDDGDGFVGETWCGSSFCNEGKTLDVRLRQEVMQMGQ